MKHLYYQKFVRCIEIHPFDFRASFIIINETRYTKLSLNLISKPCDFIFEADIVGSGRVETPYYKSFCYVV